MEMSKYCKAYPIAKLREYAGWRENAGSIKSADTPAGNGAENGAGGNGDGANGADVSGAAVADAADEAIYLFVHDNYTVTDGIARDENIVFDEVTPEWQRYCADVLAFEIPEF